MSNLGLLTGLGNHYSILTGLDPQQSTTKLEFTVEYIPIFVWGKKDNIITSPLSAGALKVRTI